MRMFIFFIGFYSMTFVVWAPLSPPLDDKYLKAVAIEREAID
jgi:hypothetical protein